MIQEFGEFIDELSQSHEYLTLVFSLSSVPLKQRLQMNDLSAHYFANYLSNFLSDRAELPPSEAKQSEFKTTAIAIANQLLEIAVNVSEKSTKNPISFFGKFKDNRLVFFISNSFPVELVSQFQAYINELTAAGSSPLYFPQLKTHASSEPYPVSWLGYFILMTNYGVKLGWKFEPIKNQPQILMLTTRASFKFSSQAFVEMNELNPIKNNIIND